MGDAQIMCASPYGPCFAANHHRRAVYGGAGLRLLLLDIGQFVDSHVSSTTEPCQQPFPCPFPTVLNKLQHNFLHQAASCHLQRHEPVDHIRRHTRLLMLLTSVVWQIAGAAAAEGLSLQEVSEVARQAAQHCRSVGVATHICTLPGAQPSDR